MVYGRLIDLFGAPRVIALTGIVAAAAVAALGLIDLQSPWLYVVTFFVGAGVIAGQGGLHALCSMLYPTRVRATGVGWALGAGRFGGMFGPLLGGMALAGHWEAVPTFFVAGLPMLLVGVATFLIGLVLIPPENPRPGLRTRHFDVARAARSLHRRWNLLEFLQLVGGQRRRNEFLADRLGDDLVHARDLVRVHALLFDQVAHAPCTILSGRPE